ncbi:MAG: anaerobic sulfatase maturase [Phycisphaerae bacterium]
MTTTAPAPATTSATRPFHVLTKPIGPICNLDCKYCFYLEKENLYQDESSWRMPDHVLETYIRQYIESQPSDEIQFAWQGGEPTLLGVPFFQKVVDLQQKFANGKRISNALQTNGTLLDDEWCAFLSQHHFLVGLSIDGPRELHDAYRVDKKNNPTFDAVFRGLRLLQKYRTEYNTLTVVNRLNSHQPLPVYRFLKSIGSRFIQFIPLVERHASVELKVLGYDFAHPPHPASPDPASHVTPWSVEPEQYGTFLCTIFDEWLRRDVGSTFVQLFDVALSNWMGLGSPLCVFAEKCGRAVAIEHNGDLYSCDHYVYPQYRLGNILNHHLSHMLDSPQQKQFGIDKSSTLPAYCRNCSVRFACNGECPKHRFLSTPDGDPGLNYLCAGYKKFFSHINPYMQTMASLLHAGRPPAQIMQMFQPPDTSPHPATRPGRNDPCPCGSGKKFKKCCAPS